VIRFPVILFKRKKGKCHCFFARQVCEDVDRELPVVTCEQIKVPSSAAGGATSAKIELADVEALPAIVKAAAEAVESAVPAATDL